MDMEAGVRPSEHAGGLILIEQLQSHEQPEHGASERLGQPGGVMPWPRDERPIRPKAAVRDEQLQVRMPVGPRAVRLQNFQPRRDGIRALFIRPLDRLLRREAPAREIVTHRAHWQLDPKLALYQLRDGRSRPQRERQPQLIRRRVGDRALNRLTAW